MNRALGVLVVLIGAAFVGAAAHQALLSSSFFVASAVTYALYLVRKGNDFAVLQFTLWLWLLSPEVRRILDWLGASTNNVALLAPFFVGCMLLLISATRRAAVTPSGVLLFECAVIAILYGSAVGFVLTGAQGAAVGFLNWAAPLGCGLFVLTARSPTQDLQRAIEALVAVALPVLAAYGIYQWIVAPIWDGTWLLAIGDAGSSFGHPAPFQLRVWGTLDSPGTYAGTLVWMILLRLSSRLTVAGITSVALGVVALGISGVRAAYIALALVVVIALLRRALRLGPLIVIGLVVLIGFTLLGGPFSAVVSTRINSVASGGSDTSASARTSFQREELPVVLANPVGSGIGSTGAAARYAEANDGFSNTDSGYLEVLKVFGPFLGGLLIVAALLGWLMTLTHISSNSRLLSAMSSVLVVLPASLLFGNVFTGAGALSTWVFMALCSREDSLRSSEFSVESIGKI